MKGALTLLVLIPVLIVITKIAAPLFPVLAFLFKVSMLSLKIAFAIGVGLLSTAVVASVLVSAAVIAGKMFNALFSYSPAIQSSSANLAYSSYVTYPVSRPYRSTADRYAELFENSQASSHRQFIDDEFLNNFFENSYATYRSTHDRQPHRFSSKTIDQSLDPIDQFMKDKTYQEILNEIEVDLPEEEKCEVLHPNYFDNVITMEIMTNPIKAYTKQIIRDEITGKMRKKEYEYHYDKETLGKLNGKCPSSKVPFHELSPDTHLAAEIKMYIREAVRKYLEQNSEQNLMRVPHTL